MKGRRKTYTGKRTLITDFSRRIKLTFWQARNTLKLLFTHMKYTAVTNSSHCSLRGNGNGGIYSRILSYSVLTI